ncbi:MAG: hypothetical protein GY870_14840 [archaeon]|nr:hypothetical protein [archaeon]
MNTKILAILLIGIIGISAGIIGIIYVLTPEDCTKGSDPTDLVFMNGILYFSATDEENGRELWKSDGTEEGTVLIKNIYTGYIGSNPQNLIVINNTLFFTADDGIFGRELWKSNGTEAGTAIVKDIKVGTSQSSSNPNYLTIMGDDLYFSADNGINGTELWKTNGTAEGTEMIYVINPEGDSNPSNLCANGTMLYFSANNGINSTTSDANGTELWKSDGTESGTEMIFDINPGPTNSTPNHITVINSTIFFSATNDASGRELWKSDGTESGTEIVKDIYINSQDSSPENLINFNGTLVFSATDELNGRELWKSDGTKDGTIIVDDIDAGRSDSNPSSFFINDNVLYFTANDTKIRLYKTDRNLDGSVYIISKYTYDDYVNIRNIVVVNDMLYFFIDSTIKGLELWKSNGEEGSINSEMVAELNPTLTEVAPDKTKIVVHNDILYFDGIDEENGWELWKSDGTEDGTNMIKKIYPCNK